MIPRYKTNSPLQTMKKAIRNQDHIEEILERLPVKSLFRFKSVSKQWRLVIESNYLAQKRLVRYVNPILLVLRLEISSDRCSRTLFLETNSKDHHDRIKIFIQSYKSPVPYPFYSKYDIVGQIMGYFNGLVCIYDLRYVYLINTAKRKVVRILSPELLREYTGRTGWSNELPITVGFGRDMVTGTYKVILMYLFDRNFLKTEAFNLDNGERRYIYFPLSYGQLGKDRRSIFANGSLYWLRKPDSLYTNNLTKLAAIDLHTETFRDVLLPSWYTKYSQSVYLWTLKDSLCLSDVLQNPSVDVWSLQQEDPCVKWEKMFSVNILSTNCLDATFLKFGLAAYYFMSTGRNPANNPLDDQVPHDHCSSVLYTDKFGSSV